MKKIKYFYFAFTLCMLMFKSYSQVTISVKNMAVYNPNLEFVSDCGEIKFKDASSIQILFDVTLSKPYNFDGSGEIKVYLKKNNTSSLVLLNNLTSPNGSFPTGTAGNVSYTTGFAGGIVINASEVDYTGSKLIIRYGTPSYGYYSTTCDYTFSKNLPSFSLSPSSISLACGDTSPRTFTVTPANIPSGANVTYQWSYNGWTAGSSTSTSKTLQPTSGNCLGDYLVNCAISNACGNSVAYSRIVTVGVSGTSPCSTNFALSKTYTLSQNPIKNG